VLIYSKNTLKDGQTMVSPNVWAPKAQSSSYMLLSITPYKGKTLGNRKEQIAGHQWLTLVILATQGGRDQEDHGWKPAWANSSRPYLEKTVHKNRAGGVAQGEGPEFKL
jgi:hypothetical protein